MGVISINGIKFKLKNYTSVVHNLIQLHHMVYSFKFILVIDIFFIKFLLVVLFKLVISEFIQRHRHL